MGNIRVTGEHKFKWVKKAGMRCNVWCETWFETDSSGRQSQKQLWLTEEEYREKINAQEDNSE